MRLSAVAFTDFGVQRRFGGIFDPLNRLSRRHSVRIARTFHYLLDTSFSTLLPITPAGSRISASSNPLEWRFGMLGKIPAYCKHP